MKKRIEIKYKGFTLIELLVVVLIIGILSAIALPQYTQAVEKSRMAEAFSILPTLAQAMDVYVMSASNPEAYPLDKGVLDVDLSNLTCDTDGFCSSKYFKYRIFNDSNMTYAVNAVRLGDTAYTLQFQRTASNPSWTKRCVAKNAAQLKICKTLSGSPYSVYDISNL